MAASFTACSSSDDGNGGGGAAGDVSGGGTGAAVVYSATELKAKIEATANDLMGKINTADFQEIADLSNYMKYNRINSNDLDNWAQNIVDGLTTYSNNNVTGLYHASNFHGEFVATNGAWQLVNSNANHLQFTLAFNGNTYILRLTHSGNETPLKIHEEDTKWNYSTYQQYKTYKDYTIYIPANLHASLTKNGQTLAEADVNTSFHQGGTNFNPQTDNAQASIKATVGQYVVNVSRAVFNPQSNAELSVTLSKGSETLITANAVANGKLNQQEGKMYLQEAGKVNAKVNVLNGRIIVSGEITNVNELAGYINMASEAKNENEFKNAINEANNRMNIGIYADNSSESSASLKFYSFSENYYNTTRWHAQPVIAFKDGSQYAIAEYFDEKTFSNVIKKFQDLMAEFAGLVKK